MMKTSFYLLAFSWLILMVGCEKNSGPNPADPKTDFLFKATFTNEWLPANSVDAIIFVSDKEGNFLSEHNWLGDDSFEMMPFDENAEYPESINITTIYYNQSQKQFILTTNLDVPVGSEWTFKGTKSANQDRVNKVDFIFQNVPVHKDYMMSSKWNTRTNASAMSQPFSFNFFESPADIFLMLKTVEYGNRYTWFRKVVEGQRSDNLSVLNMSKASSKTIPFTSSSSGLRMSLHGYPESGQHYGAAYRVDVLDDYTNIHKSVTLSYPESDFTDYRCRIVFFDYFTAFNYWTQISYGPIPGSFKKIDADFDLVSTSINNFKLAAVGDYMQTKSVWADERNNIWTVNGGKSLTEYKLPILSPLVIEKFKIDRALFKFQEAALVNYPELKTYNEVLDISYKSPDYLFNVIGLSRIRTKLSSDSDRK